MTVTHPGTDVVTGAFGYVGRYVTQRLLAAGRDVITLTGHPERAHPFGDRVRVRPYAFADPVGLAASMRGAETLFNTYWIRFSRGGVTFDQAVRNSLVLIRAAEEAGIRRIVHVSITNPSSASPLPYFRGKGQVEEALRASGLSHAIIRPTLIFGKEDILINNIAWLLRRFPFFVVPGSGEYRLQPVFVGDMADLMVRAAVGKDNLMQDAVGPEVFTFNHLVKLLRSHVRSRAAILHGPPWVALALANGLGLVVRDVPITRTEIGGVSANLLLSANPPTTPTRFSEWLSRPATRPGLRYSSELQRHFSS